MFILSHKKQKEKEATLLRLSQDFVGDFFLDRFFWLYMVL